MATARFKADESRASAASSNPPGVALKNLLHVRVVDPGDGQIRPPREGQAGGEFGLAFWPRAAARYPLELGLLMS